MREDTERPDRKKLVLIAMSAIIMLVFSNLSMAEVAGTIKEEIAEHDVLSSFGDIVSSDSKSASTSSSYNSGSGSGSGSSSSSSSNSYSDSNSDSNSNSNSNSLSSGNYKEPANTDLYSLLKKYTEYYNNGIDEVPDVVKKVAGNDVILIDLSMNDNSDLKIKVKTEDGLVTEFRKISSSEDIDPTVTLTSNENTIRAILKSSDPLGYFITSLNNGSVNVECKGFMKKAALTALKAVA